MKIGYVGLGNMGRPIAANLARAGFQMIVFDQNQKTVDSFVKEFNARTTNGLQALAEASDIIIAILPTGKDVRQILVGDDSNEENLISGLDNSKLFIDMSSSEPEGTLELGKIMDDKNIPFLDAPVSGGSVRLNFNNGRRRKAYYRACKTYF